MMLTLTDEGVAAVESQVSSTSPSDRYLSYSAHTVSTVCPVDPITPVSPTCRVRAQSWMCECGVAVD